jgi:hypothetical protein
MSDFAVERDEEGRVGSLWLGSRSDDGRGVPTPQRSLSCEAPGCRNTFQPEDRMRGAARRYCSADCRRRDWERQHPRVGVAQQAMIEWTPAASAKPHAVRTRETKAQRILARLQAGPATSYELAQITHRFSARLLELRRAGHVIEREDHVEGGREWSSYFLTLVTSA